MGGDPLLEFWERSVRQRRIAGAVMAACAVWLVGCFFFPGVAESFRLARQPWDTIWGISALLALLGLVISGAFRYALKSAPYEARWCRERRRGTVVLSALRPGPPQTTLVSGPTIGSGVPALVPVGTGQQYLACTLDVRVSGVSATRGDYLGAVGPLDAPKFLDGAVLTCEANPSVPERVRIWPHADVKSAVLMGSFLDFAPVKPVAAALKR